MTPLEVYIENLCVEHGINLPSDPTQRQIKIIDLCLIYTIAQRDQIKQDREERNASNN